MYFKNFFGHFLVIFSLSFFCASSSFAFVGEKVGTDLFKTIDSGVDSMQNKLIENELKGSASKINNYVSSKFGGASFFDTSNDFTKGELDSIREDNNVTIIFSHLKDNYKKSIDTEPLEDIRKVIIEWYSSKEGENIKLLASVAKIGSIGLYNDGDEKNSGYDIMYDIEQIHKVIFKNKTSYNGTKNSSFDDFNSGLNGDFNSISPIFSPDSQNNNNSNNSNTNNSNNSSSGANDIINQIYNSLPSNSSNLCNSGSDLTGLGDDFYRDLNNELTKGTNSNSSIGGIGNSSYSNNNSSGSNLNNTNLNSGNSTGVGGGGSIFDSFPCSGFFCIAIDTIMYSQNLFGGGDSSIEGILDKNAKIIDKYQGKSLIQSNFTKNFFSLSILKSLNLPSMLHLGVVVTHLPPPILNLETKNKNSSKDLGSIKTEDILISSFAEYGLNYKKQNYFNPDYEYKNITDCTFKTTEFCNSKLLSTKEAYLPPSDYSDVYYSKLQNIYRSGLGDDIAQFYGFSYTFQHSIDAMVGTIKKLKEKCK